MPPVHADEMKRPVGCETDKHRAAGPQKGGKFRPRHLARGHREFRMLVGAASYQLIDATIVRRIGKHHRGAAALEQSFVIARISSVAAKQAMSAQHEKVAQTRNRRLCSV